MFELKLQVAVATKLTCMFKVNNRNTRTRCEICSKLTIKTRQQNQSRPSGVYIVNFEHIPHPTIDIRKWIQNLEKKKWIEKI